MFAVLRSTEIWFAAVSLPAPTWKVSEALEPSSRLIPLKFVLFEMRVSSSVSCVTSVWMSVRESALFESFAACTARSRMRWRIEWTSVSAPSAVCTTLMPS